MKTKNSFVAILMLFLISASGRGATMADSSETDHLNWTEVRDGVQMAIEIAPPTDGDPKVFYLNVYIHNVSDHILYRYEDGDEGLDFFTAENGKRVMLHPPFNVNLAGYLQVKPGDTVKLTPELPPAWLEGVQRNIYILLHCKDAMDAPLYDVVSPPIDIQTIADYLQSLDTQVGGATMPPAAIEITPALTPPPPTHKPRPKPPLAQAESPSYTTSVLVTLGVLVVAGFYYRRRK